MRPMAVLVAILLVLATSCQPSADNVATLPPDASALSSHVTATLPDQRAEVVWQPAAVAAAKPAPAPKSTSPARKATPPAAPAPLAGRPAATTTAGGRPEAAPAPPPAPPKPIAAPSVPPPAPPPPKPIAAPSLPPPAPPAPKPFVVPMDRGPRDPNVRGGVGVRLEKRGSEIMVVGVIPNSPCQRAGVQVGDVIVRVDGRITTSADILGGSAGVRGVTGRAGSAVTIVWRRGLTERTTRLVRVDWAILFPDG